MPYDSPHAPEWEPLLEAAWGAWEHAYVPYSRFQVGAAVLLHSGKVVAGCNVENASFPVTLCAERTALCAAVTSGLRPDGLEALVVVTKAAELTPPCGACRQALAEFAETLPVLLVNQSQRLLLDLRDLLPRAFTGRSLGVRELPNPVMNS